MSHLWLSIPQSLMLCTLTSCELKVLFVSATSLVTVTKYLTRSNWQKESIWLVVWEPSIHHNREGPVGDSSVVVGAESNYLLTFQHTRKEREDRNTDIKACPSVTHFLQLYSTSQRFYNISNQEPSVQRHESMRDISYFNHKIVLELIYLVQRILFQ